MEVTMLITRKTALDRLAHYFAPPQEEMVRQAFANEPPEMIKDVLVNSAKGVLAGGTWVSSPEEARQDLAWIEAVDWSAFASVTEEMLPIPAPYPTPEPDLTPIVEAVLTQPAQPTAMTDLVAKAVEYLYLELGQEDWSVEECLQFHVNLAQAQRLALHEEHWESRLDAALTWMIEEGATEDDMSAWFDVIGQFGVGVSRYEDNEDVGWHHVFRTPDLPRVEMEYSPKTAARLAELPADKGGIPHPEQLYNALAREPASVTEPAPQNPHGRRFVVLCKFKDGYKVVYAAKTKSKAQEAMKRANQQWHAFTKMRPPKGDEVQRWMAAREPVEAL
jgi:hypothetical protein